MLFAFVLCMLLRLYEAFSKDVRNSVRKKFYNMEFFKFANMSPDKVTSLPKGLTYLLIETENSSKLVRSLRRKEL